MYNAIRDELSDKKWPKIIVRNIQGLLNKWGNGPSIQLPNGGTLKVVEYKKMETFFGYYDRSPISSDNRYLLFYASSHSTKLNPTPKRSILLVLYDLQCDKEIKHWTIWSYNWQQGSKAQWLTKRKFIFNNFNIDKGYYSVVFDIENNKEEFYTVPNYESCNEFLLSLNFCRLSRYRPDYGYRNITDFSLDDSADGIFKYDFDRRESQLLFSIDELKNNLPTRTMDGACHKVNHIMLSPNRDKFMFMHRWLYGDKKDDRLYVYEFSSKKMTLIADYGMVSHCYWKNNDCIVGYMNGPGKIAGYFLIDMVNNTFKKLSDSIQHYGDGHPSINGSKMIIDTYPDNNRRKHLYMFDFEKETVSEIAILKEWLGFECQCRCDCHPRFVKDGLLLFDSTHTGKRQLCILSEF